MQFVDNAGPDQRSVLGLRCPLDVIVYVDVRECPDQTARMRI